MYLIMVKTCKLLRTDPLSSRSCTLSEVEGETETLRAVKIKVSF